MSAAAEQVVSDVMTANVATLSVGEHLDLAEDIMRVGRIRHMPVVDGKKLVGMLSGRDVLAASLSRSMDFEPTHRRAFLRAVNVEEVMSRSLVTVMPDTPLVATAERMCEQKIGCLPVVDERQELVGIVTETDLVRAAYLEPPDGEGAAPLDRARRGMREASAAFGDELDALRRTRDELRVQVRLGRAEARDRWDELERKWRELEAKAVALGEEAREPLHEAREVAEDLMEELHRGYRRLARALRD